MAQLFRLYRLNELKYNALNSPLFQYLLKVGSRFCLWIPQIETVNI